MEWSHDRIMEFLDLYQEEECIWNPKHPNHRFRYLVHDAWRRIQDRFSFKCDMDVLKKKRDTLMCTYRKLSSKVRASCKTSSGADDIYKPDWFAYEKMSAFLHTVYKPQSTQNSEVEQQGAVSNEQDHSEDQDAVSVSSETLCAPTEHRKRRRTDDAGVIDIMAQAYNLLNKMSKSGGRSGAATEADECSLYGQLLATKLRSFDENTRAIIMLEIDKLIITFKERMQQQGQSIYVPHLMHNPYYTPHEIYSPTPSTSTSISTFTNSEISPPVVEDIKKESTEEQSLHVLGD